VPYQKAITTILTLFYERLSFLPHNINICILQIKISHFKMKELVKDMSTLGKTISFNYEQVALPSRIQDLLKSLSI
jgi:hypothetical protein